MITDTYSDLPKKKASLILYDLLKNNEIQRIEIDSLEKLIILLLDAIYTQDFPKILYIFR